ncbi:MAG: hypothetical protein GXY83_26145 [Rhodopirellula sp.]|mgnify:CR=1 FL=1|nr:hypothetical protein [Rhodopirellula sp.]
MSTLSKSPARDRFVAVTVRDPTGHRHVILEGLRASASVPEIRSRAIASLHLSEDVDWALRHDASGRLLGETQKLSEFADKESPTAELTLQPDAGLG